MGEWDILEWLKNQRAINDKYFSTKEVLQGLKRSKFNGSMYYANIRKHLVKLADKKFLETKIGGTYREWHIRFRCREKYIGSIKSI